mmetsp:Transcript_159341/g.487563  ORF Transcript_159341/g.487563 Transcript_159341/m.487563 type:complete len:255 (+) Transcript_159341:34-798(+)
MDDLAVPLPSDGQDHDGCGCRCQGAVPLHVGGEEGPERQEQWLRLLRDTGEAVADVHVGPRRRPDAARGLPGALEHVVALILVGHHSQGALPLQAVPRGREGPGPRLLLLGQRLLPLHGEIPQLAGRRAGPCCGDQEVAGRGRQCHAVGQPPNRGGPTGSFHPLGIAGPRGPRRALHLRRRAQGHDRPAGRAVQHGPEPPHDIFEEVPRELLSGGEGGKGCLEPEDRRRDAAVVQGRRQPHLGRALWRPRPPQP